MLKYQKLLTHLGAWSIIHLVLLAHLNTASAGASSAVESIKNARRAGVVSVTIVKRDYYSTSPSPADRNTLLSMKSAQCEFADGSYIVDNLIPMIEKTASVSKWQPDLYWGLKIESKSAHSINEIFFGRSYTGKEDVDFIVNGQEFVVSAQTVHWLEDHVDLEQCRAR